MLGGQQYRQGLRGLEGAGVSWTGCAGLLLEAVRKVVYVLGRTELLVWLSQNGLR